MRYLTSEEYEQYERYLTMDSYTEDEATEIVMFAFECIGCTHDEAKYIAEWYFDGYIRDMARFGTKYGNPVSMLFAEDMTVIDNGDAWDDDHGYPLPTGRTVVYEH